MGTTYRFVAAPGEPSGVLSWFRSLPQPPTEVPTDKGAVLHFKACGPLLYEADGSIQAKASPIATVFLPRHRREVFWTVGEVHFLTTPLRQRFPALHKISSAFSKWLASFPCVFSNDRLDNEFAYYLEGSTRNYAPPIYAFESGLVALRSGRYFVSDADNEQRLDVLCRALRLRGVECTTT